MNYLDPRVNNYYKRMWYIDPRSPLTLRNYKILFRKNPSIRNLNTVARKIGSAPTKRNINRVLKAKQIHEPKEITLKIKKRKIQTIIKVNNLLKQLQKLQSRI
jgi:hypothetical protein